MLSKSRVLELCFIVCPFHHPLHFLPYTALFVLECISHQQTDAATVLEVGLVKNVVGGISDFPLFGSQDIVEANNKLVGGFRLYFVYFLIL